MTDNKLRIPRKLKTETYKQQQIRSDMIYICFCSSMFTNTTAWAKELGAIALPTFKKSWGGEIVLPPFLVFNLGKNTVLL